MLTTLLDPTDDLMDAISRGDAGSVRQALKAEFDVNASNRADLVTPLMSAARKKGNEYIVRLLLAKGADVNKPSTGDHTPLMYGVSSGDVGTVRLLIESGADLDVRNDQGVAAQDIALSLAQGNKGSYEEIYRILKEETETRRRLKAEAEIRQRLEREAEARQRLETFHETATLRQTILKSHLKRPVLKFQP